MKKLFILLIVIGFSFAQQNIKGYTRILSKSTGEYSKHGWNHYGIGFFALDKKTGVLEATGGKVSDFSKEGYIGLQNHDWDTKVSFKNIFIKEL